MAASVFRDSPSSRSGHTEVAQINITPLVDVMLVLLVIFMVATPVMSGRIDLRLPQPVPGKTLPPPERVMLRVDGNGRFTLDGVALDRVALPQALRELMQADPRTVVQITANADADYQDFAWTLAEAQRNGVRDIAWE
ncbi:ExbD/TolR family protein [Lysobacter auxotrophicus]|uniref:Biopolymer transporter ExbD n=1 Tax=Lysobacter auxotrophicus TaxID=2992573 RepID=A0ABN6UEQ3_9GAMM|nr:biopolymer transporter ExbD [Lysobacter auxotrophicus]BDU14810.1 biopolymer transporter ExbD [Lysobacter auxotrophicus]